MLNKLGLHYRQLLRWLSLEHLAEIYTVLQLHFWLEFCEDFEKEAQNLIELCRFCCHNVTHKLNKEVIIICLKFRYFIKHIILQLCILNAPKHLLINHKNMIRRLPKYFFFEEITDLINFNLIKIKLSLSICI